MATTTPPTTGVSAVLRPPDTPSRHAPRAQRAFATAVISLVLNVASTFLGRPVQAQTASQDCTYEGSTVSEHGEPLYFGGDPSRRPVKIYPFRITSFPCPPSELRAVHFRPGRLELVAGGQLMGRIPFPGPGPVAFERIAAALQASSWVREVESGVFELSAALVQAPGTAVTFTAPAVKTLRLVDRPGVFIAGRGATARFDGVTITSWNPVAGGPDQGLSNGRPFLFYSEGSRLDLVRTEASYLGSDRTSAYGVNWGTATSGEARDSMFHHNFFGAYTNEARDVVFRRNVFHDNVYYGWDPHTSSRNLVVEDNEAYGNGSHGFIASQDVVDSVIRRNYSHHNGGNGIVLHRLSNRNLVEDNRVEDNAADGIVVIGSSENLLSRNVVRNHRTGVRIHDPNSDGNRVRENLLEDNEIGVQAYDGARDLVITDNRVVRSRDAGMVLDAPRSVVTGGEIRSATTGLEVRTITRISDVKMSAVGEALVVSDTGIADVEGVELPRGRQSVRVEPGGLAELGTVPLEPGPGLPARPLTALAGAAAVSLAVALHVLARRRSRRERALAAPPHVWNTA